MKEIKDKSPKDLEKLLVEKRGELRAFRFGMTGSRTKNVKAARTLRKEIAGILSAMTGNAL